MHCCEIMMCKMCYMEHEKRDGAGFQHQKKMNLVVNKDNKLKVLCEKHGSQCICADNTFCVHIAYIVIIFMKHAISEGNRGKYVCLVKVQSIIY